MTALRRFRCLILAAGLALRAYPAAAQASPVGFWNTISDDDARPTAVVEIRQLSDSQYVGIVRAFLVPADAEDSVCGRCSDERRGQRIIGMQIVRGMRRNGDAWSGGEILDPQNGKTYRAKMHLEDGGRRLVLRGYIGVSLFGRSQTWLRRQ